MFLWAELVVINKNSWVDSWNNPEVFDTNVVFMFLIVAELFLWCLNLCSLCIYFLIFSATASDLNSAVFVDASVLINLTTIVWFVILGTVECTFLSLLTLFYFSYFLIVFFFFRKFKVCQMPNLVQKLCSLASGLLVLVYRLLGFLSCRENLAWMDFTLLVIWFLLEYLKTVLLCMQMFF